MFLEHDAGALYGWRIEPHGKELEISYCRPFVLEVRDLRLGSVDALEAGLRCGVAAKGGCLLMLGKASSHPEFHTLFVSGGFPGI